MAAAYKMHKNYRRISLNSTIKNIIQITEKQAQYDEKAKHLLGQKIILAHILAKTVKAFSGMKPKDILPLIEGEPQIGIVPIEPGMTNTAKQANGEQIIGFNRERIS